MMAAVAKHSPPLASARWLISGLLATLAFAVLCVYLTFCLLFWQGQWQLIFKPSRSVTHTPATADLHYDNISFGATETGVLELRGWWVPAEPGAHFAQDTMLVMHDGTGSLTGTVPQVAALHSIGINVFVFDYRGFGESVQLHPSEASTQHDAEAAWEYLTGTRHLPPSRIALDGVGLGAAIAAEIARRHPETPALILENPSPPVLELLQFDSRTHLLPLHWLVHDRFDIRATLTNVKAPTLVLHSTMGRRYAVPGAVETSDVIGYTDGRYTTTVQDFLDKYLSGQ
jgi:uncharacterized protein